MRHHKRMNFKARLEVNFKSAKYVSYVAVSALRNPKEGCFMKHDSISDIQHISDKNPL